MSERDLNRDVFDGPVLRTFAYYAVPSLVGLVAISTASIVDGWFVSRFVGAAALASINLLLPYFTLLFGASLMLAMGGSVQAGRSLGAGAVAEASAMFGKSVFAVVSLSATAALLGNAFDETLYRLLGAPEALFPLMRAYFRVISAAMVVQLGTLVVYYFVRLDGRPVLATTAVVSGAACNIVLNALLVGHLGWGIEGAAYATAFAQTLQLVVLLSHFRSPACTLQLRGWSTGGGSMWRSAYLGASELVNEVSVGLVALIVNWLMVSRVGIHGVAAFTVVSYATFASLMVYYGGADALHLLVSQNAGAGDLRRARAFLRVALGCAVAFGGLLATGMVLFGEAWLGLFVDPAKPEVMSQASAFLGVVWPQLLFNGANVMLTVYLAATQRPGAASTLSLSRSLVLPAVFLFGLAHWAPSAPFVAALPLAEGLTLLIGVALWRRSERASGTIPLEPRREVVPS
jgi:Na+-driven multidrug efflux pump